MSDLDTRVSLSLHPDSLLAVDGYNEESAPYVAGVATALSEAYQGIGKVHTAREKAKTNPTWNDALQIIHTQDLADKVFANVAKRFDRVKAELDRGITALDAELSTPLTTKASQPLASEIRAHAKNLSTGERVVFLQKAIERGDEMTVSSLLGAPSYLSGLNDEMQTAHTKHWHRVRNPAVANRLKVMEAGRELLMQRAALVHSELEKAVGEAPHKVQALRAAKTAAEQAFILENA